MQLYILQQYSFIINLKTVYKNQLYTIQITLARFNLF